MYVCGVSRGLSWLATKAAGSAGGVRTAVAAGTGVSPGREVAVDCNPANAVSKACVSAGLMSGVDGGAGWQAVRIVKRSKKRRMKKRNVVIIFLHQSYQKRGVHRQIHLLTLCLLLFTRPVQL